VDQAAGHSSDRRLLLPGRRGTRQRLDGSGWSTDWSCREIGSWSGSRSPETLMRLRRGAYRATSTRRHGSTIVAAAGSASAERAYSFLASDRLRPPVAGS
jgi:hypothetical protein